MRGLLGILSFFATSLIISIIREQECYHMTLKLLKNHNFGEKMSRFCYLFSNVIIDVITFHTHL